MNTKSLRDILLLKISAEMTLESKPNSERIRELRELLNANKKERELLHEAFLELKPNCTHENFILTPEYNTYGTDYEGYQHTHGIKFECNMCEETHHLELDEQYGEVSLSQSKNFKKLSNKFKSASESSISTQIKKIQLEYENDQKSSRLKQQEENERAEYLRLRAKFGTSDEN